MEAQVVEPISAAQCAEVVAKGPVIARGLGRSYGDSSLGPRMVSTRRFDHLLAFDPDAGVLQCEAGVTLDELLRVFVPRGWLPPVVPGTRYVTVGGAIASDIHGKNHHLDGSFGAHVREIEVLLGSGDRVQASASLNADLFRATCGGMGLTGVILSATLQLRRLTSSQIVETIIRAPNLDAVLEAFAAHSRSSYSVAWIDCVARGFGLGRSVLMLGEHAVEGSLEPAKSVGAQVPLDMPAWLLNRATARAFNALYFRRATDRRRQVALDRFFFPLDALSHWNRLYGAPGFVQYQFVVPKAAGPAALREVLRQVSGSSCGAFLAVLKLFGAANDNFLSFPREGYTLALDLKAEAASFSLMDRLDAVVLQHGGRLYLTKDARMSEATFKASYPAWPQFEAIRDRWHAHGRFASGQSRRLGLL
ncbi:MAG: FAD-binding oxidoreductase [Ramlibacter sp.]|nr:FAD-binding oxidoreductase [Ramlibacter sp.]